MSYQQPLCRSSDPLTSYQAADRVKEFRVTHESKILRVLRRCGPMGVDEIAILCGLEPHAVGKRMNELARNDLVFLTGQVVKSSSGRNQREWAAV